MEFERIAGYHINKQNKKEEKVLKNKIFLPLDNAAKIYPAAMTKKWNAVFAISVYLKEKADKKIMKSAVEDLYERFPSFYVCLKQGAFWDYFCKAKSSDIVSDSQDICRPIDVNDKKRPLFRINLNGCEIRCEFFHALTDGTGAMEFVKALILRYFQLCGCEIENAAAYGIKEYTESPEKIEYEDEFLKIYDGSTGAFRKGSGAYQLKLQKKTGRFYRDEVCISLSSLKELTKKYDCTVTQFIAAAYSMALIDIYSKDCSTSKKPLRLAIPVNLRKFWKSATLRNFSSFITADITPNGKLDFETVLSSIKSEMNKKISKEQLYGDVCRNVADEKMLLSRIAPSFLKKPVMKAAFRLYGERKYTSTVTNLGNVKLPPEMADKIDLITVTLGETYINPINCAVVSFADTLCATLSFAGNGFEAVRYFMDFLSSKGLEVSTAHTI